MPVTPTINPKDVVILQRSNDNQSYGEIHISGSKLILYIDSSGYLNADFSASFYSQFPPPESAGLTPGATYSITASWAVSSSWASQSFYATSASWAPPIASDASISSSWASQSFSSVSSSWASASISASHAVSASHAESASYMDPSAYNSIILPFEYKFDTNTTMADPGPGYFRYDSGTPSNVVNIYIDQYTNGGLDASSIISRFLSGSVQLYIQQKDDATRAALFDVAGNVTDNLSWYSIPVLYRADAGGGIPGNNRPCALVVINRMALVQGTTYNITSSWSVFSSQSINSETSSFAGLSDSASFVQISATTSDINYLTFVTTSVQPGLSYADLRRDIHLVYDSRDDRLFSPQISASGITASFFVGTASVAISSSNSLTSSFSQTSSFARTASFSESSSFSRTSSFSETSSFAQTSSFARTASFSETSSFSVTSSWSPVYSASAIPMLFLTRSKYTSVQSLQDIFHSSGWTDGGEIISGSESGSFKVNSGAGLVRGVNNVSSSIYWFGWPEASFTASGVDANTPLYVYVNYNGGIGTVMTSSIDTSISDYQTNVKLGQLYYASSSTHQEMHINTVVKETVGDHAKLMILFNKAVMPYARESGGVIGLGGGLTFTLTAGAFWEGLNRFTTDAHVSGSTFSYYYRSGSTWFEFDTQTASNLQYNDVNTGLVSVSPTQYKTDWVFLGVDSDVRVVFGTDDYTSLTLAEAATVPATLPPELLTDSFLVGRIIAKQNTGSLISAASVFDTVFTTTATSDHNSLSGLQGGVASEYYHLTNAEYTGTGTGVFVRQSGATLTASLYGTSSWAVSASWAPEGSSTAASASIVTSSLNASFYPVFVSGSGPQGFMIDGGNNLTYNPSTDTLNVGILTATMKSFLIDHPTKKGMKLRYGNVESPYHGVQLTGRAKITGTSCMIELPDYIHALVKDEDVNIQLTNIGHSKLLYVKEINLSKDYFVVGTKKSHKKKLEFFWMLTAVRKDVPDLVTEV